MKNTYANICKAFSIVHDGTLSLGTSSAEGDEKDTIPDSFLLYCPINLPILKWKLMLDFNIY